MAKTSAIEIYQGPDGAELSVEIDEGTVWLNQTQMADLFQRDQSVISRHINNAVNEGEVDKESNMQNMHIANSDRPVTYYDLDVIISVGYRVKSLNGTLFRRWATEVLRRYVVSGHVENRQRLAQLGQSIKLIEHAVDQLSSDQVKTILTKYARAFELLDEYDHKRLPVPKGDVSDYHLSYEECRNLIESMRYSAESDLFGFEPDERFKSTIGQIYQSFGGEDLYPSLQEKAATQFYLAVKNHPFADGNKRIAAALFVYFLEKTGGLCLDESELIDTTTLAAITLMIACSHPDEKDMMVLLVMNFLAKK
jgi:death-on-curing family protein